MTGKPQELDDGLAGLAPLTESGLRVVDQVHAALVNALAEGTVRPGARLLEVPIAEQLGVSRTPVREAFQRLQIEGLAQRSQGRGLVFTAISPGDVADLGRIRVTLDELAARCAAEQGSKQGTKQGSEQGWEPVQRALDLFDEAVRAKADRVVRVRNAHREFHLAIYRLAFTPLVSRLLEANLIRFLDISTRLYSTQTPDWTAIADHARLLAALRSGEPEHAAALSRAHALEGTEQAVARARHASASASASGSAEDK
jgi:DNA-binding GntR family transcriptional regulator